MEEDRPTALELSATAIYGAEGWVEGDDGTYYYYGRRGAGGSASGGTGGRGTGDGGAASGGGSSAGAGWMTSMGIIY